MLVILGTIENMLVVSKAFLLKILLNFVSSHFSRVESMHEQTIKDCIFQFGVKNKIYLLPNFLLYTLDNCKTFRKSYGMYIRCASFLY